MSDKWSGMQKDTDKTETIKQLDATIAKLERRYAEQNTTVIERSPAAREISEGRLGAECEGSDPVAKVDAIIATLEARYSSMVERESKMFEQPFRTHLDEVAAMRDMKHEQAIFDRLEQREANLRDQNLDHLHRMTVANDNERPPREPSKLLVPNPEVSAVLNRISGDLKSQREPTMIEKRSMQPAQGIDKTRQTEKGFDPER